MPRIPKNLLYSRRFHDRRIYGSQEKIYIAAITPIVRALFREEIEQARRRVVITSTGKYYYTPSNEYIHFITHFKLSRYEHKTNYQSNQRHS